MYRPKRYVRLNQLPRMPRLADVKNLFEEGKKARSCTVELPWRTEKLGMTFSLTVRVDIGGSEPIWTLYEGEGNRSRVMWSTGFADVDLLYDVLTLSLPSDGPNIFAPPEEVKPEAPVVEAAPQPTYYDSDAYRRQSKEFEAGGSFSAPTSPFLKDDDQFLKPQPSTFDSFSKSSKNSKDEFALPAVPESISKDLLSPSSSGQNFQSQSTSQTQPQAQVQAQSVSQNLAQNISQSMARPDHAPLQTSEMINPYAEPQIALGAQHQNNANAQHQNNANAQPQNAANAPLQPGQNPYQTGQYPAGQLPGGQPQPNQNAPGQAPYPNAAGYPSPPGGPVYPGYNAPGYPPQYAGYPPQYAGQYPPPPQYAGQYPGQYPPYPQNYNYPPQGSGDPLMPAGTVPLGNNMPGQMPPNGMPGAMPNPMLDQYGMPIMPGGMTNKKPAVMLGSLLVEAGLVPKSTIDSALQVQVLVSQGTLSPVKAAEAVRRAHLRGGAVEPEVSPIKPNDVVVRIKPQIGQVLVMAGIITAVQLKAALYLQDVMRGGTMTMEEAVELLRREATSAQVKSQTAEQIKAPVTEDLSKALALTKQAGLLTDADLEAAEKVKAKHGGEISKILMVAGKLDDLTLDAAKNCQKFVDAGKLRVDQAIMALHYCQRMRVPFEEAAGELNFDVE